jgi:oligosaccharyltransferase complex subunit gamma
MPSGIALTLEWITCHVVKTELYVVLLARTMLVLPFLAVLLVLPFSSANGDPRRKLVTLAAASKGLIHLDESTFESLTASDRNWSAAIQFTAMDKRRRCAPCK